MRRLGILLAFLVMLVPIAAQDIGDIIDDRCKDVSAFDYAALTTCQVSSTTNSMTTILFKKMDVLVKQIIESTKTNPNFDRSESYEYFDIFQKIFAMFIVLILTLTGFQFIISNDDPIRRSECKRRFKLILFSGALLILLPLAMDYSLSVQQKVYSIVLDETVMGGEGLKDYIDLDDLKPSSGDDVTTDIQKLADIETQLPLLEVSTNAYVVSMNARDIIVLLLMALSPIGLLLFIFEPTKSFGKLFAYLFLVEICIPICNIIVIHYSIVLSGKGEPLELFMLSSSLLLSVVFHAALVLATVFKASVSVVNKVSVTEVTR